MAIEYRYFR